MNYYRDTSIEAQSQSVWGCFPFFLPLAVSDSYNLDPLYVDETLTHSTWKPRYVDETLTHSMWMTQSQSVWGCFPFFLPLAVSVSPTLLTDPLYVDEIFDPLYVEATLRG